MISPRDLRIGNWVNVMQENACIEKFITEGIHFSDGCSSTFSALDPIPLSSEILEKCGFEDSKRINLFGDTFLELDNDGDFFNVFIRQTNSEGLVDVVFLANLEIKYLHQLQNLYYDLTGQELNVQL